ncbi:MAG TPA: hypothetical protein VFH72_01855 [Candidatus Baltobacteraceae bacterium]|nr:hypothetical protein [Candidatus Baltobacteraceae bacterium]
MARILFMATLALAALAVIAPMPTQAFGPYFIQVNNHSNHPAWITIYSLHKVRIEASGRVEANGSRRFKEGVFTTGSYHHVRFQWMSGKSTLCDTDARAYISGNEYGRGADANGYYSGGNHCHIQVFHPTN